MAINYASKYASNVDERFRLGAVTTPAINNNFDWVGVKTVQVYSVPTVALGDYTRTGANRYGTPSELDNTLQELTLSQDKAFTFTIDRGNYEDTMMVNAAGSALQREIDEVVIPTLDIYRLAKMAASAGKTVTGAVDKTNAYDAFLDATAYMTDNKVPLEGRMAYISPAFYKAIKQDETFIKASDVAQEMLVRGMVGMVDGIRLITVPTSYLPENTMFMVTHPVATVAPVKLADYQVHDNPPGINGWLVEGRIYYDAFVLNNKKNIIYVHNTTAA